MSHPLSVLWLFAILFGLEYWVFIKGLENVLESLLVGFGVIFYCKVMPWLEDKYK